jgi:hypothetical protein
MKKGHIINGNKVGVRNSSIIFNSVSRNKLKVDGKPYFVLLVL